MIGALVCLLLQSQQPLFTIARSTNANLVQYDARVLSSGALDPKQPVVAYWMMLAQDEPKQRALAGAVRADQAMDLAGLEREVHGVSDVQATEMLVQLAQFEQRHQPALRAKRAASRPSQFITPSTSPFGAIKTVSTSSTPMKTSAYWLP